MTRRFAPVLATALLLALACGGGPPIDDAVVQQLGGSLCGVGHPNGTFTGAEITNWRDEGPNESHDRYVDVAVHYDRANDPGHTMLVRLYVESKEPCRVSVDVLEDDGPSPVLLDNGIASEAIGGDICTAMPK